MQPTIHPDAACWRLGARPGRLALACSRPAPLRRRPAAAKPAAPPPKVRIVEFDRNGKRLRAVDCRRW
jgi:hypothetical protein